MTKAFLTKHGQISLFCSPLLGDAPIVRLFPLTVGIETEVLESLPKGPQEVTCCHRAGGASEVAQKRDGVIRQLK